MGKIQVIDVATKSSSQDVDEKGVTLSAALEEAEISLDPQKVSKYTIYVNSEEVTDLDTVIMPGSTLLITRNISGN